MADGVRAGTATFWLAVGLLLAVAALCGMIAAFVSWRGGANPFNAALTGFKAFGGTTGLALTFFALIVALGSHPASTTLPGLHQ
ncbi:hypothetical protein [Nocardia sp. NPDC004722]